MIRARALLWSLGPLLWQLLTSLRPPDALEGDARIDWLDQVAQWAAS